MRHSDKPITDDERKVLTLLEFFIESSKNAVLNELEFEPDHLNRILDNLSEISDLTNNYLQDHSIETNEFKVLEEFLEWQDGPGLPLAIHQMNVEEVDYTNMTNLDIYKLYRP